MASDNSKGGDECSSKVRGDLLINPENISGKHRPPRHEQLRALYKEQLRALYKQLRAVYKEQLRAVLTLSLCLVVAVASADFESAAEIYRKNNYLAAMKEFQTLAEQDEPRAQTVLALMYKYGEGTPIDLPLSFHWYLRAAELNYAPAQYHTGVMLGQGVGVEVDLETAIYWLTKSAEGGYSPANEKLEEYNATGASIDVSRGESTAWSKHWDFSLPNDIRFPIPKEAEPSDRVYYSMYYKVQLGAMNSRPSAERLWQFLTTVKAARFDGLSLVIEEIPRSEGTLYRVQTGQFSSLEEAGSFCKTLVDDQILDCIPVKHQPPPQPHH